MDTEIQGGGGKRLFGVPCCPFPRPPPGSQGGGAVRCWGAFSVVFLATMVSNMSSRVEVMSTDVPAKQKTENFIKPNWESKP